MKKLSKNIIDYLTTSLRLLTVALLLFSFIAAPVNSEIVIKRSTECDAMQKTCCCTGDMPVDFVMPEGCTCSLKQTEVPIEKAEAVVISIDNLKRQIAVSESNEIDFVQRVELDHKVTSDKITGAITASPLYIINTSFII